MRVSVKFLKEYRTMKGWNQQQMADFLGVGFRTYQEIEKTGVVKKSDLFAKIAEMVENNPQLITQKVSYGTESISEPESNYSKERLIDALRETIAIQKELIEQLKSRLREKEKTFTEK